MSFKREKRHGDFPSWPVRCPTTEDQDQVRRPRVWGSRIRSDHFYGGCMRV